MGQAISPLGALLLIIDHLAKVLAGYVLGFVVASIA